MRLASCAGMLLGLTLAAAAQAEPASLIKADSLRAQAAGEADVIGKLAARTPVDIQSRKGAWAQVKTSTGQIGWLRLLNLRTGSGQKGESGLGAVASLFKTGSSGTTVSTGVKGLSEEKLKHAEPDAAEAKRLDRYKGTENDARRYAAQARLNSQTISYLDADDGEQP